MTTTDTQVMLGKVENSNINHVWANNVDKSYLSSNQQPLLTNNTFGSLKNLDSSSEAITIGPTNPTPNGPISPMLLNDAIMGQIQTEVVKDYSKKPHIPVNSTQSTTHNTYDPITMTIDSNYTDIFITNKSLITKDPMETQPLSPPSHIAHTSGSKTTLTSPTDDTSEATSDKIYTKSISTHL